jgi:hypothetical protein
MTSSRTLVFLVLVSVYGLTLLSLVAGALSAVPGAALSPGAGTAAADSAVPLAGRYHTVEVDVEVDGVGLHLPDTGHFALEEDGAVVTRLARDLLASHVPTDG